MFLSSSREIYAFVTKLSDRCFCWCPSTVPLKSKLTVPRASILEPRDSILDSFESRVSSLESRVSSIELRVEKVNELCANQK